MQLIKAKSRITEKQSYNLIIAMAKYGNHYHDIHRQLKTVANIEEHFQKNKLDFKLAINKCRDFSSSVPMYENLATAQWATLGVTVSRFDSATGKLKEVVSGDGLYNEADYWANFDLAREDFDNSINTGRYERFLSAVGLGISSIEAFLNHQYLVATKLMPENKIFRIDLEMKIDQWIPAVTGGRYDKGCRNWDAFKRLKKFRNEDLQHRKSTSSGITFKEQVKLMNEFKFGICMVLFDLHVLFKCRCPTSIIRYSYFPEIVYVKV